MPSQSISVLGEVGIDLVSESEKTFPEESYIQIQAWRIFIIETLLGEPAAAREESLHRNISVGP